MTTSQFIPTIVSSRPDLKQSNRKNQPSIYFVVHSELGSDKSDIKRTTDRGCLQDLKLGLNDTGPVSGAARTGEAVNLRSGRQGAASSMLCMPVFDPDGLVAGVVQVVGKKGSGDNKDGE